MSTPFIYSIYNPIKIESLSLLIGGLQHSSVGMFLPSIKKIKRLPTNRKIGFPPYCHTFCLPTMRQYWLLNYPTSALIHIRNGQSNIAHAKVFLTFPGFCQKAPTSHVRWDRRRSWIIICWKVANQRWQTKVVLNCNYEMWLLRISLISPGFKGVLD